MIANQHILVTGATGLLGSNFIHEALKREINPVGVSWPSKWVRPPCPMFEMDIRDETSVQLLFQKVLPRTVYHFAAMTSVDWCEANPAETFALNSHASGILARAAKDVGARFVYMSTDAVFDGIKGGYTEKDPPKPLNVYGRSKLAGEEDVLRNHPEALVVRSNIFGWNAMPKKNLAEWIIASLRDGQEIDGYTDSVFAPLLVNTLSEWMIALDDSANSGIIHVACRAPLSKYDFAVLVARNFGLKERLITPRTSQGLFSAGSVVRPQNSWLDGSHAVTVLGRPAPDIIEMIGNLKELEMTGYSRLIRDEIGG